MMKVLFSLGAWEIREGRMRGLYTAYASHLCPPGLPKTGDHTRTKHYEHAWLFEDDVAQCYHCGTQAPEEIQTVIVLYKA